MHFGGILRWATGDHRPRLVHLNQRKRARQHVEVEDTRKFDCPFALLTIDIQRHFFAPLSLQFHARRLTQIGEICQNNSNAAILRLPRRRLY